MADETRTEPEEGKAATESQTDGGAAVGAGHDVRGRQQVAVGGEHHRAAGTLPAAGGARAGA